MEVEPHAQDVIAEKVIGVLARNLICGTHVRHWEVGLLAVSPLEERVPEPET